MSNTDDDYTPDPICTWADFKREVESRGVKDTDQIAYIDWSNGNLSDDDKFQFRIDRTEKSITIT
jgi:hypothetical protein